MTKAYVVMEVGYEYNDETYDREQGGTPCHVFFDRDLSEKHRRKLTLEYWRKHFCGAKYGSPVDYTFDGYYNLDAVSNRSVELEQWLLVHDLEPEGRWQLPADIDDEHLAELVDLCDEIEFYIVKEVEAEE